MTTPTATIEVLRVKTAGLAQETLELLASADGYKATHAAVTSAKGRIDDKTFIVAMVGRQRSGKSTLMNALVGEHVAPVDVTTCTAAVSVIKRGATPATIVFTDPTRTAPPPPPDPLARPAYSEAVDPDRIALARDALRVCLGRSTVRPAVNELKIRRDDLRMWVTHDGNPKNHKAVVLTSTVSNHPSLPPDLYLVDSPGIGAPEPLDMALASLVAAEADATIMSYAAAANLGREELEFLVQHLAVREQRGEAGRSYRRHVFVVQNDWPCDAYTEPQQYDLDCEKIRVATQRNIAAEWARRQASDMSFPRGPAPGAKILRVRVKQAWHGIDKSSPNDVLASGLHEVQGELQRFYAEERTPETLRLVSFELIDAASKLEQDLLTRTDLLNREVVDFVERLDTLGRQRSEMTSEDAPLSKRGIRQAVDAAAAAEKARISDAFDVAGNQAASGFDRMVANDVSDAVEKAEQYLLTALKNAALRIDRGQGLVADAADKLGAQLALLRRRKARSIRSHRGLSDLGIA